jgi:hypothetical protein
MVPLKISGSVVSASSGSIPGKKLDLYGAIEPVSVMTTAKEQRLSLIVQV